MKRAPISRYLPPSQSGAKSPRQSDLHRRGRREQMGQIAQTLEPERYGADPQQRCGCGLQGQADRWSRGCVSYQDPPAIHREGAGQREVCALRKASDGAYRPDEEVPRESGCGGEAATCRIEQVGFYCVTRKQMQQRLPSQKARLARLE